MADTNIAPAQQQKLEQLAAACIKAHRKALRDYWDSPAQFNDVREEHLEKESLRQHMAACVTSDLDAMRFVANLLRTNIRSADGDGVRDRRYRALRRPYLDYVNGVARIMFNADLEAEVANG